MNVYRIASTLFIVAFLFAGCFGGGGDTDSSDADAPEESATEDGDTGQPENLGDALNQATRQMQEAFGGDGESSDVEVVDFRVLRERLPEELAGMKRVDVSGERSGAFGIKISQAEGEYEGEGREMEVTIIDMGTLSGAAMLGYAWLNAEIDRESDTGFERTTTFDGYPAFQQFEHDGQEFEMQVVVNSRIIVQTEGHGMSMDDVEDAIREIGLDDLKDLVPAS